MSRRPVRPSPPNQTAAPAPSVAAASARTNWLAAAIIVGAALLAYANTFSAPFIFDDEIAITKNASIRHLWPPWEALAPPATSGGAVARPLINFSFALNYALGGLHVEGYHVLNLLIHAVAGLTLFGLVRRALGQPVLRDRWSAVATPVAFFTALLWTVHPLLTESVTCVVQRTESLVGLWYLLMFYCLVRAAEPDEKAASPSTGSGHSPPARLARHERRPKAGVEWLMGSFTACLLGMLTKEVMATAPLLALVFQATLIDGSWRTAWMRRGKFFALLALCWVPLAFLVAHNSHRSGSAGFGLGVTWWEYALTQCRAIIHYLALAFWPHPLVVDYGDAVVRTLGEVWPQALALAGLLAVTVAAAVKKIPAAFAGWWFFIILSPSSSVLPLVTQTLAEHRMYLPLAAVVVLVVAGVYRLAGRWSPVLLTGVGVGLAFGTVQRNEDYRSELSLWRDTAAKAPANARAHNNLGNVLVDTDQEDAARQEYERAVQLQPTYATAHFNLANVLARQERLPEAIAHYQESIRLNPTSADPHTNLGNTFLLQSRWADAAAEFSAALQIDPDDAMAHNNLGNVLVTLGRPAEAVPHYEAALRFLSDQSVHFNLATALAASDRIPEAMAQYQVVLQLAPGRADAHARLGTLLVASGQREQGIAELLEALRLKPDNDAVRQQLTRLGQIPPSP